MTSPELGPFRSVLDEAPWALEAADIITGRVTVTVDTVTGWTPPRHHCPDGICADMAAAANLDEQAADERSFEAWARTVKGEIRRAKAIRGKRVRMLRRALTGAQP